MSITIIVRAFMMSTHVRSSVGLTQGTTIVMVTLVPNGVGMVTSQTRAVAVICGTMGSIRADVVVPVSWSGVMITTKNSVASSGMGIDIVVPRCIALIVAREAWASIIDGVAYVAVLSAVDTILVLISVIAVVAIAREEAHSCAEG